MRLSDRPDLGDFSPARRADACVADCPGPEGGPGGGLDALAPHLRELGLDLAQAVLDVVGLFEPTPFADGTNALISVARGDWFGAVVSGVSVLPYVGDLAKVAKIPRLAKSVERAVDAVKADPQAAAALRPALDRLAEALADMPTDGLPRATRDTIERMRAKLGELPKKRIPHRSPPRVEDGTAKEGWRHIDERHVSGTAAKGPGDLFPPGTTRAELETVAADIVKSGTRQSHPEQRIQTFEKVTKVNGQRDRVRVVVDADDHNRIITMHPVRSE